MQSAKEPTLKTGAQKLADEIYHVYGKRSLSFTLRKTVTS